MGFVHDGEARPRRSGAARRSLPGWPVALGVVAALVSGSCGGAGAPSPTPLTVTLPAPNVPTLVLADRYGGPMVPERICIRAEIDDVLLTPVAEITAALRIIGIEVASSDCDAILRIDGTAKRLWARYSGPGACWNGFDVDGTVSWVIDGAEVATWPVKEHQSPPQWASTCTDANEPIRLDETTWAIGPILAALFGGAGFAAGFEYGYPEIRVQPTRFDGTVKRAGAFDGMIEPPDASTLSEAELDVAVARIADALWRADDSLARDWLAYRILWLEGEPCCARSKGALDPLVPYLIGALAAEEPADKTVAGHLSKVLGRLTLRSYDSAADWWKWWQGRS